MQRGSNPNSRKEGGEIMKKEECFGCKYLSASKKNYYCGYRMDKNSKAVLRKTEKENIKNIDTCFVK